MQPFNVANDDHVVEVRDANGIPGEIISVRTDLGNRVNAWRPNPPITGNPEHGYFCHGFSLGTCYFASLPNAGYSVTSGKSMVRVLADEYVKIGDIRGLAPLGIPQSRDLIIWWQGTNPVHSALLEVPVTTANGLDTNATLVSSKTGTGIVKINVPLSGVNDDYPNASLVELYRRA
jgi:hypothetical protein